MTHKSNHDFKENGLLYMRLQSKPCTLKVPSQNRFLPEIAFSPIYYPKKSIFEIQYRNKTLKKSLQFWARSPAPPTYVKEMAVAGLKINFLKF